MPIGRMAFASVAVGTLAAVLTGCTSTQQLARDAVTNRKYSQEKYDVQATRLAEYEKRVIQLNKDVQSLVLSKKHQDPISQRISSSIEILNQIRAQINASHLNASELLQLYELDNTFYEVSSQARVQIARDKLNGIKKELFRLTPTKVLSEVRQRLDNGDKPSLGSLTRLLIEVNEVQASLNNYQSPASTAEGSNNLFKTIRGADKLSKNLEIYRLGCFSKYVLNRIETIRSTVEKRGVSENALIDSYLEIMSFRIPNEGLTYGVSQEFESLRSDLFNKRLKEKGLKQRAHQRLLDKMFTNRMTPENMSFRITINDF